MEKSRATHATPNDEPNRRSCAAHGRGRCGEAAIWMLHGAQVTYPACRRFVEEHQIPTRNPQ